MVASPGPRRLIVSGDDFGMSAGVNSGILRAHRDGILTNASLMVNGAACREAVELARATPALGVGLHLVLVQGKASSAPSTIPGLVDPAGQFRTGAVAAGMRYFFAAHLRSQLEREVCAQIEKFLAFGLSLSHVDGHLNIHMHPTILAILLRVAPRYGIRALRLPREPWQVSLHVDPRERARKLIEAVVFRSLCRHAARRLAAQGIRCPDHLFGLHQSGHLDERYALGVIPALPPGITELYCHPALADDEARRWRPPDYEGEAELAALTSARVRTALAAAAVHLVSYRDLSSSG